MKVGDLVKAFQNSRGAGRVGVVVKLFEKKIWRTMVLGKGVPPSHIQIAVVRLWGIWVRARD